MVTSLLCSTLTTHDDEFRDLAILAMNACRSEIDLSRKDIATLTRLQVMYTVR